jgi:KaiC/GvpD/RAD55 family RecA-like ATPase
MKFWGRNPFQPPSRRRRRSGQRGLYVTLSETIEELNDVAVSHGLSLDGIELLGLNAIAERLEEEPG